MQYGYYSDGDCLSIIDRSKDPARTPSGLDAT